MSMYQRQTRAGRYIPSGGSCSGLSMRRELVMFAPHVSSRYSNRNPRACMYRSVRNTIAARSFTRNRAGGVLRQYVPTFSQVMGSAYSSFRNQMHSCPGRYFPSLSAEPNVCVPVCSVPPQPKFLLLRRSSKSEPALPDDPLAGTNRPSSGLLGPGPLYTSRYSWSQGCWSVNRSNATLISVWSGKATYHAQCRPSRSYGSNPTGTPLYAVCAVLMTVLGKGDTTTTLVAFTHSFFSTFVPPIGVALRVMSTHIRSNGPAYTSRKLSASVPTLGSALGSRDSVGSVRLYVHTAVVTFTGLLMLPCQPSRLPSHSDDSSLE
uniref:Uncharacterized protein n=1 Tax=Anopheles merus TaxID=30066 RepID=A0A182V6Z9_ANOME